MKLNNYLWDSVIEWIKIQYFNNLKILIYLRIKLLFVHAGFRTKSQALAVYLFWLKTSCYQDIKATYFGAYLSQRDISRYCDQVRVALNESFFKENIGPLSKSCEELLNDISLFAKAFYQKENDEKLFLIGEWTYLYCQKSLNNQFQRDTYSVQRKQQLVKPFVLCTTNGYIFEIFGLYSATKN